MIDDYVKLFEERHKELQRFKQDLHTLPQDFSNRKAIKAQFDAAHYAECAMIEYESLMSALLRIKNNM